MRYKLLYCILPFFILSDNLFAQDNKVAAQQFVDIADEILTGTFAYDQARDMYLLALGQDPENIRANYMAGQMFLESVDKARALTYFLKTYELDHQYSFDLLYKIGLSYHYGLEFDDAINFYQQYLAQLIEQPNYSGDRFVPGAFIQRKIYECEVGAELVAAPRRVSIKNLGSAINSEYDDNAPVVSAKEDLIIFTSRRLEGNLSEDVHTDNLYFEDIFYSNKYDGKWAPATNIGTTVNTVSHNSNLALSPDGTQLYTYNDINNGDIFVSTVKSDGTWSKPVRMEEPINSEYNENGVSFSDNGNLLFFSSNRPGGLGGSDIYVSERNNAGHWRRPKNLGDKINTDFDEEGPFMGPDGKTLYFSSQGGRGMGGFDIFKSEYDSINDSWGEPENLGYPINTPDEDVHFSPTQDGFRAFYATTRDDGFGYTDIYEITFLDDKEEIEGVVATTPDPEPVTEPEPEPEPEPVLQPVIVNVQVLDADSGVPISTKISLLEVSTGIIIPFVKNSSGAQFTISEKGQKEYTLTVEKDGFAFYNQKITLPGMSQEAQVLERVIRLKKIEKGYSTILRNIYFDFGKVNLKDASMSELTKLHRMLTQNPGMEIGLVGYTDIVGTEEFNLILSKRRAKAVKEHLVNKGIDPRRVKTGGLGSMFPLASNDDEKEGRELNRRVEMVVLRK